MKNQRHTVRAPFRMARLDLPAALVAVMASCLPFGGGGGGPDRTAGPCTETGNPTGSTAFTGTVRDGAGNPIAGAALRLYAVSGGQDGAVLAASARSCADGSFSLAPPGQGAYAVEAVDTLRGLAGRVAGLEYPDPETPLDMVLRPPGSVRGRASRGGYVLPAGVPRYAGIVVRLLDTDRSAVTDDTGGFAWTGVPEGTYRAVFVAPDGHFLPRYLDSVRLGPGEALVLPLQELEWSPYIDPPAPERPRARTEGLTVRLAWPPVRVSNLAAYEISRHVQSGASADSIWSSADTAAADAGLGALAGNVLAYRLRTVNALGNRSPWSEAAVVSLPDTAPAGESLTASIVDEEGRAAAARVRLYRLPDEPGARDSLPPPVRAVDSADAGPGGSVRFHGLAPGRYALEAIDSAYGRKAWIGPVPPGAGQPAATLRLQPTGGLRGKASRGSIWFTTPYKGDDNIRIGLAETPYAAYTGFDGSFRLGGVPAGSYRAVYFALPEGSFLADTVTVTIRSGSEDTLPVRIMAVNPDMPPPKPTGLFLERADRDGAMLRWDSLPPAYTGLQGYEVVRMDADRVERAVSPILGATRYADGFSGALPGTRFYYAVRAVDRSGRRSPNAGDAAGRPVEVVVP